MFTGLVEGQGRVESVQEEDAGKRLTILWPDATSVPSTAKQTDLDSDPLALGESVAINGCCLTVVATHGQTFQVQAGPETLARTNIGSLSPARFVNLERALRASDRLGGHFVQGHVDTTATVSSRRTEGDWEFFRFEIDSEWTTLLVPKGSIAVNGVSLTLVEVKSSSFSVMLIPHTLMLTNLGSLSVGDHVNIETDILAKHVRKLTGLVGETER